MSPEDKATELKKRITTAAILIAAFLAFIFYAKISCTGHWLLIVLAILVNLACAYEFTRVCTKVTRDYLRPVVYFILLILPGIYTLYLLSNSFLCTAEPLLLKFYASSVINFGAVALIAGLCYCVWAGRDKLEVALNSMGEVLGGLVLIGFGSAGLISLSLHTSSHFLLLWLIVLVASVDSGAYFAGKAYGKTKLAPAISPGKSVLGLFAGLICGTAAGLLFSFLLSSAGVDANALKLAILSLTCGIAAQTGDLTKSVFKRLYGVKDSGNILPGHGGILDRVDGMLAASIVLSFFVLS